MSTKYFSVEELEAHSKELWPKEETLPASPQEIEAYRGGSTVYGSKGYGEANPETVKQYATPGSEDSEKNQSTNSTSVENHGTIDTLKKLFTRAIKAYRAGKRNKKHRGNTQTELCEVQLKDLPKKD